MSPTQCGRKDTRFESARFLRTFICQYGADEKKATSLVTAMLREARTASPSGTSEELRNAFLRIVNEKTSELAALAPKLPQMLPHRWRFLLLVEGCGSSYGKAAEITGYEVGTIKSGLHRLRKILADVA